MNIPWAGILVGVNETLKVITRKEENHDFLSYFACAGLAGKLKFNY